MIASAGWKRCWKAPESISPRSQPASPVFPAGRCRSRPRIGAICSGPGMLRRSRPRLLQPTPAAGQQKPRRPRARSPWSPRSPSNRCSRRDKATRRTVSIDMPNGPGDYNFRVRVDFGHEICLVATNSKRTGGLSRRTEPANALAADSAHPNHAHLRRARFTPAERDETEVGCQNMERESPRSPMFETVSSGVRNNCIN